MKISRSLIPALICALLVASVAAAQRTRNVGDPATTGPAETSVTTPKPAPAPATVKVKYEGGLIGYGKTEGTLNFDDANQRLIFRDKKENRELFSVPYKVVIAAWPDTQSRRSTAGTVLASTVPYGLGLPGLFWKKTHRYLALRYSDPDTKAEGIASFKMENKDILASVLYTFAGKAGLTQRGDAFVRRSESKEANGAETMRRP